jgi:hypothetical protein
MRFLLRILFILAIGSVQAYAQQLREFPLDVLRNKIRGGWAGQTIGVTFGGPYEFRFQGTYIDTYQPLDWDSGAIRRNMLDNPGLYDDLYMDLTFVDVIERYGIDAPVDSFAMSFARAGYMLWHANQAARYNLLNGIAAPASGHWTHNLHADDIDYQIEADFAGLMNPGMPNAASAVSDKVGHIMNYGDGWYGGVYMGAMYALAFVSNDIESVVREALKTIPENTRYHRCISDVIRWHKQWPDDWQRTWFEIQRNWAADRSCPDGIFHPFNIDATVNSAYVVLGLLYGRGDFSRTMDIATRAGQDADCNPSSAAGILGTMVGYSAIPAVWKNALRSAEQIPFKYTDISLEKAYALGLKHALEQVRRQGGRVEGSRVFIPVQTPAPVRFEQGFPGMYPAGKKSVQLQADSLVLSFTGNGFVLRGEARKRNAAAPDAVLLADMYIDGVKRETIKLPTAFTVRRHEIAQAYPLPEGSHVVKLVWTNPNPNYALDARDYIFFTAKDPSAASSRR